MTLEAALSKFAAHRPLLIASDFDGTIAPIVTRPELARPDPEAMVALQSLARHQDVDVALVSGRPHETLRRISGDPEMVTLVGEHGNDVGDSPPPPGLAALIDDMKSVSETVAGSSIEVKPNSVGFHYRNSLPRDVPVALRRIRAIAASHAANVLEGKMVIELSLASLTKLDAVNRLRRDGGLVLYLGDDVTDEDVFEGLSPEDVGVKVGEGETAAQYRVEGVDDVRRILHTLLDAVSAGEPAR
jgi:trehalose 6-phosphate phosphatase